MTIAFIYQELITWAVYEVVFLYQTFVVPKANFSLHPTWAASMGYLIAPDLDKRAPEFSPLLKNTTYFVYKTTLNPNLPVSALIVNHRQQVVRNGEFRIIWDSRGIKVNGDVFVAQYWHMANSLSQLILYQYTVSNALIYIVCKVCKNGGQFRLVNSFYSVGYSTKNLILTW